MNSNRGVEITAQTGSVASAPWPDMGGSCSSLAGQLQQSRSQVKADVSRHDAWLPVYSKHCDRAMFVAEFNGESL